MKYIAINILSACCLSLSALACSTHKQINALHHLQSLVISETTESVEGNVVGNAKIYRYEIEEEGLIRIGSTEWVYLLIIDDIKKGSEVVVAIDHDGDFYLNRADACGGLIMVSPTGQEFKSMTDFLASTIYRETWERTNPQTIRDLQSHTADS